MIKKPEVYRGVVALRGFGLTYARIGEAMNLSMERVRQIWLKHLRMERAKCHGCRPEPLEIDMEGMTITMRWVMSEHQYGDAPIEADYRDMMIGVARALDETFNDGVKGEARKVGFILLAFPFGESGGRCNYISNGADRGDVIVMLREQLKRFEGMADQEGHA